MSLGHHPPGVSAVMADAAQLVLGPAGPRRPGPGEAGRGAGSLLWPQGPCPPCRDPPGSVSPWKTESIGRRPSSKCEVLFGVSGPQPEAASESSGRVRVLTSLGGRQRGGGTVRQGRVSRGHASAQTAARWPLVRTPRLGLPLAQARLGRGLAPSASLAPGHVGLTGPSEHSQAPAPAPRPGSDVLAGRPGPPAPQPVSVQRPAGLRPCARARPCSGANVRRPPSRLRGKASVSEDPEVQPHLLNSDLRPVRPPAPPVPATLQPLAVGTPLPPPPLLSRAQYGGGFLRPQVADR